ncbi:MAG TPA: GNAT family N-acetyltransferase [Acidimicrobiia bacterium]|nr:GNAT family N-acetyltransferase [Acidimicrobiia bacterium]
MTPSVAGLEGAAYATWSPDERIDIGGWTVMSNGGWTRRVNSAGAVGTPETSIAARDAIASWLSDRGSPFVVRVTPLIEPGVVDEIVESWGLERQDETIVMTAGGNARANAAAVQFIDPSDRAFTDDLHRLNARGPSAVEPWLRIVGRMAGRAAGLWIPDRACGVVALDGRFAPVYSVAVDPGHRRQGLATQIMAAAAAWSSDRGATTRFLQVLGTNAAAVSLYRGLGFEARYRYHYLTPTDDRTTAP